jgi:hypothetical protein
LVYLTFVFQCDNQVGDTGACGLGEGLKVNSSLHILNLVSDFVLICCCCVWARLCFNILFQLIFDLQENNLVGDAGACGLGQGLQVNSGLEELNLVSGFLHFLFCVFCGPILVGLCFDVLFYLHMICR